MRLLTIKYHWDIGIVHDTYATGSCSHVPTTETSAWGLWAALSTVPSSTDSLGSSASLYMSYIIKDQIVSPPDNSVDANMCTSGMS